MRGPFGALWAALAFMGLAGGVAWLWQTYPSAEPLSATAAAWVQGIGSVAAIIFSSAFAIGVPLYLEHRKVRSHRRAWVELLSEIAQEMTTTMWFIESGGQAQTKYVPGIYRTREQQLASFPIHELADPKALSDAAHARGALIQLVEDVQPELHRPRVVWDRLRSLQHNVWQAGEWGRQRYGLPETPNPGPNRVFGTDPGLMRFNTWDDDGNPIFHPPAG